MILVIVLDKEFISAPVYGRDMEASEVHHLWKLGSWGVRSHRICRVHRGDEKSLMLILNIHIYTITWTWSCLLQQYFTMLSERTVAYINVDIAVFGKKSHTLSEKIMDKNEFFHHNFFLCIPQPMQLSELQECPQCRTSSSQPQNRWVPSPVTPKRLSIQHPASVTQRRVCLPGRCTWTWLHVCVWQLDTFRQQDQPGTWSHSEVMNHTHTPF